MHCNHLSLTEHPKLNQATMLLSFSGWMNGGNVSLGSVEYLRQSLQARPLGLIEPEVFYIYNFPGNMELTAMFRPHVRIEGGLIQELRKPMNRFHYDAGTNLILFEGKEPNFHWREYADCILAVAKEFDVQRLVFIGSVGGVAPHTRDPRMYCTVSSQKMKQDLEPYGVRFSDYEGPASFVTYLSTRCTEDELDMASVVAEIPAYIQGANPRCIEGALRKIAAMNSLEIDFDALRKISDRFERRIDEVIQERPDLVELIEKLESDYDNEIFNTQMGDLKQWLEGQGIQVD